MTVILIVLTAALAVLVSSALVGLLAHAIHADRLLAHRHAARVRAAEPECERRAA